MFVGNKDQKQYLNLSKLARDIIDFDSFSYMEKPELAGFINMILDKYMEESNAAISLRVQDKRAQLKSIVLNQTDENLDDFIEILIEQYKDNLIKGSVYPKDKEQLYFRLSNNNFNKIYSPYCQESDYYKKGGDFIKAVIEEYTRLPFHVRERIMLQDKIDIIQKAIDSRTLLIISTGDRQFAVRPYRIMLDEQHRYYYLTAIARRYLTRREINEIKANGEKLEEERIVSFRIARIQKIGTRSEPSGRVTKFERLQIEKKLSESGVMFLIGNAETIKLKLTDAGLRKYRIRLNQRPAIKAISGEPGLYKTKATRRQMHNFFFDFGDDLEIISPADLREEFFQRYLNAAAIYERNQSDDCHSTSE